MARVRIGPLSQLEGSRMTLIINIRFWSSGYGLMDGPMLIHPSYIKHHRARISTDRSSARWKQQSFLESWGFPMGSSLAPSHLQSKPKSDFIEDATVETCAIFSSRVSKSKQNQVHVTFPYKNMIMQSNGGPTPTPALYHIWILSSHHYCTQRHPRIRHPAAPGPQSWFFPLSPLTAHPPFPSLPLPLILTLYHHGVFFSHLYMSSTVCPPIFLSFCVHFILVYH